MLVSLKGGAILYGGAPLGLVVEKSQKIRSLVYRTAEYLKNIPHRKRGEPSKEIRDMYRPWIFQSEPASYQFKVSVQKFKQLNLNLLDTDDVYPERIVGHLFKIFQTCSESPLEGLSKVVPEEDYRMSFLKLVRDLTPTSNGADFTRLDIQIASAPHALGLNINTRYAINEAIRLNSGLAPGEEEGEIRGILRALHLDNDWIRILQDDGQNVRINRAGDEVDDRIGPMVNHRVTVRVANVGTNRRFLDIELDE